MSRCAPFLLAGALALVPPALQAQSTLGFRGGVSIASADVDDLSGSLEEENRTGWSVGTFLALGNGLFVLQPELSFTEKGFELIGANAVEVKLRYLEPSLLLKAGVPLGPVRADVFGGVGIGFEASCSIDGVDCDSSAFGLETTTDWSALFGADVGLMLGSFSLWGDVRYAMGLTDIEEASDVWDGIENRSFLVQVGVGVPLSR
ncbi:MAG: outer membrane beta-barrel protein [Gemmatimonadota bacterium]